MKKSIVIIKLIKGVLILKHPAHLKQEVFLNVERQVNEQQIAEN